MLRFLTYLLLLLLSVNAFATPQRSDYLMYQGEKYRLHTNPLEELFFVKKELRPETEVRSSGNWRGYIATFSINEDYLVVSDITIAKRDPNKEHSYLRESVFLKTFPNESDRKMDWFTGLLVVPLGKRTRYVHLSYASQYENYLLIRIKDGLVLESDEMNLEEYMAFKVRQFEAFKATPAYEARYKVLSKISDHADDFDLEGFIFKMGGFTQNIDIPFKSPNKSSN